MCSIFKWMILEKDVLQPTISLGLAAECQRRTVTCMNKQSHLERRVSVPIEILWAHYGTEPIAYVLLHCLLD